MPKRTERHVRKVKATLQTPAARSARALAASPDGGRRAPSAAAALASYASSVPGQLGGSTTPDATGQVGTPGTLNVFGYITGEDYNPDLDGFPMFPNYNKMRLGDAQVNATLLMLKLPLKGATWIARPASDDPQDVAIADFVQANLIDDDSLARSWQHVLDNAMLKFDFGCAAAEVVWGVGDDLEEETPYVKVIDLAPRLPRTFYRWVEDPKTGQLAFLQQFAPKNGQYGYWNIEAANLALHVRAREGNNFYGRSVLRTAYAHWWWKQQLYRIDMIGHDRFHVGIPRAKLTEDYSANSAPLDKIEATLKGLRSHDRAYMVQPFGVEYDVYGAGSSGTHTSNILNSIEHHNLMIARNILQSFAAQGEQRHGSFGAAKVTSDVFYDALVGEANEIGSELKQGVVKRLCDLNFDMHGRKCPTIVCTDISAVDFNQMSEAFNKLVTAKIVTPDDELEDWFRDMADAPPMPEELKGQDRSQPAPPSAPPPGDPTPGDSNDGQDDPADKSKKKKVEAAKRRTPWREDGRAFSRVPSPFERKVFDLHGVPAALDMAHSELVHALARIRREQLQLVAGKIAQKDARPTAAFTDIRHTHITMPKADVVLKAIRTAQTHALALGRSTVRAELGKQGVKVGHALADDTAAANARTATSSLVSSARITSRRQSETWLGRILDDALRLRRAGVRGPELVARIVHDLEDEAESGARRDAASEIHEAFGIGRALEGNAFRDQIEHVVYSAILDTATCETCSDLDGEEFIMDSPEYDANLPPNANCDGRDQCRCVYLFVATGDAEGEAA